MKLVPVPKRSEPKLDDASSQTAKRAHLALTVKAMQKTLLPVVDAVSRLFSHSFLHMFKKMLHGSKSWTLFENLFENFFCISWITLMLILRLAWLLRTLSRPMRKTFIRQHEFIEFRVAISKANKLSSHFVNIFWRSIFSIGPSLLNLKEYPILNSKSHPHVRCKQTLYAESKITTL